MGLGMQGDAGVPCHGICSLSKKAAFKGKNLLLSLISSKHFQSL